MWHFITGLFISLLGVVATVLAYASGDDWQLHDNITLGALITGLIAFFLVWVLVSIFRTPYIICFIVGCVPVFAAIISMTFLSLGDAESMMWLPIAVVVALIYGFPIALCSSVGGNFAGRWNRNKNAEVGDGDADEGV